MPRVTSTLFAITVGSFVLSTTACAAPVEEEEEDQAGALADDGAARDPYANVPVKATCNGARHVAALTTAASDEFAVIVGPGSAVFLYNNSGFADRQITVIDTASGTRRTTDSKKNGMYASDGALVSNGAAKPKKFIVQLKRIKMHPGATTDDALAAVTCLPIVPSSSVSSYVMAAYASGVCRLGQACTQTDYPAPRSGTCSDDKTPNLGDGPKVGFCR